MTITIEIDTDNAAFGKDDDTKAEELTRIIHNISGRMCRFGSLGSPYTLKDSNGNTVGSAVIRGK